ncbi:response regulator transcription factor [Paenibacillus sp. FJAT-26967]|uniref:response regulator n=1 Tax=Paenibacillus sp. FJAT-26967 TaxID=1729690 RepID=UPI0008399856|nr:response regulator transcription factor [Paenibacillus sp. FJAT-26967]
MNNIQQILIVDDHPAMAYGTKFILEQEKDIQVVGVANSGESGIEMMMQLKPSIIFLDFHLPDLTGMEVAVKMREIDETIQIVIFTGIDYMPILNNLLDLGVCGIMSKDSSEEQIRNMMRSLKEGQTVIPISLLHQLRLSQPEDDMSSLTDEEINIMNQIVKGATNEQIADEIHMSKRSVDNYVRKIYDKFGVKSRAQAIEKFIQMKR